MITHTIASLDKLQSFANELLALLPCVDGATVLALTGDLGAGKTALTKALAQVLGIKEDITSPTFVIMKSYTIPKHERFSMLVHIDAYRIDEVDEMRVIGLSELLADSHNLVVIEWPERIQALIPEDAFPVTITITKHEERVITYGH